MKRIFIFGVAVMAALGSVAADGATKEVGARPSPVTSLPSDAGGEPVGLEALVAQALRENPELQFYRAELTGAKAGRKAWRRQSSKLWWKQLS